jgi:NADPH:quinone reductase-like Zn-dependent oxidoreductase
MATTGATETMQAILRPRYGSAHVLELGEVGKPELVDDGVLVRVRAASVNQVDWYGMTGTPWFSRVELGLRKPKSPLLGTDFAGTVEAVGKDVTDFQPGDDVFGGRSGAFAEYVCARKGVARKPANVSFEEAAAVPVAALTALQALRDKGHIEQGQKVLVNGASGGVGTFAVQIAKALGAEITAVCSTKNVDRMRSLGADRVIDYTREDFTRSGGRYDLLLDVAGSKSWSQCKRVLAPRAIVVLVGGRKGSNRMLGPLGHAIRMWLGSLGSRRKAVFFVAKFNRDDMNVLAELLESGKVAPVVERSYPLSETPDAIRHVGEGHPQGKIVIAV